MVGKKVALVGIGTTGTIIGIIGIWVPGVPTTPFILIALWAFSQSSERLHRWLLQLPLLAPAIREAEQFSATRTLARRTKIIAQVSAWLSFVVVTVVFQHVGLSIGVGLLAVACSIFMWKIRTR